MNELEKDFPSKREMTQDERDIILQQIPEWRDLMKELNKACVYFRSAKAVKHEQ